MLQQNSQQAHRENGQNKETVGKWEQTKVEKKGIQTGKKEDIQK